jgi:hypothetical protein
MKGTARMAVPRRLVLRVNLCFHNALQAFLQAEIMNKCCVLPLPVIKCTDLISFRLDLGLAKNSPPPAATMRQHGEKADWDKL